MGRRSGQKRASILANEAKKEAKRAPSQSKGGPRGGAYAGAAEATFLQPLPSDAPSSRLSRPPKVFDPYSPLRKRKRSGSLSSPPRLLLKSDVSPSPRISSSQRGLIRKSTLKLGKMPLINTHKRLQQRRRGRLTPRPSSSRRRQRRSRR